MSEPDLADALAAAALSLTHDIADAALADGPTATAEATGRCHDVADRLWDAARVTRPDAAAAACAPGCGWCCRQPVAVSAIELLYIARHLADQPDGAALHARLAGWSGGRTCPLLIEERCAIHPLRPLKCRGLFQPDVRWCMMTFAKRDPPAGTDVTELRHAPLEAPRRLYDGAALGLAIPLHRAGLDCSALAFVPALRAVIAAPDAALAAWWRGSLALPPETRLHGFIPPGRAGTPIRTPPRCGRD